MDDRKVVMSHMPKAQLVKNMVETGLSAQDIMAGVVLSHGEYLALFDVARRSLFERRRIADQETDQ